VLTAKCTLLHTVTADSAFAWILSLLIFYANVVTRSGATGIRIDVAGISMSYCGECRTRDKLKQVLEPAFEITRVASGNVSQCRSDIRLSVLLLSNFQLLTIAATWNEDGVLFSWTTLNLEERSFSETSVSVCQSARRHVSEDLNVYQHHCRNLNRIVWAIFKFRYCRV
jgi:hypothetical protein